MSIKKVKEMFANIGIHVTIHGGKMEGIPSISTSCLLNPECNKRCQNKHSVCSKCYARRYLKIRKGLKEALERNYYRLQKDLDIFEIPVFSIKYFRFESFGDLFSVKQFLNYYVIASMNKLSGVKFALWTKNGKFTVGMKTCPENLQVNFSVSKVNPFKSNEEAEAFFEIVKRKYPVVNRIFCVYEKDYAKSHDIRINCGKKKCLTCGICYENNNIHVVNEILK